MAKKDSQSIKSIYDSLPKDPAHLKVIQNGIKELASDMQAAQRLKESQAETASEICASVKEQTGFSPANLKKLAKIHMENNAAQIVEVAEDVKEAYDRVIKA